MEITVIIIKGKSVVGKMRFGVRDPNADAAILGPLPPVGSQIFKGFHVLLSCVRSAAQMYTSGSDTESCTSSNENYRFSNTPFVMSRLQMQLKAGGATVYSRFEDLPTRLHKQAFLISNRPSKTATYVLCLAAGVRPISHEWVIRCCTEDKQLKPQELPYGWSLEREVFINSFDWPVTRRPLRRKLVIISAGSDPSWAKIWTRVCELAEANVRQLRHDSELSRAFCVLCECGYRDELTERVLEYDVPLVTTIWLVQTLIHGELRDFNRLPCYKPEISDLD